MSIYPGTFAHRAFDTQVFCWCNLISPVNVAFGDVSHSCQPQSQDKGLRVKALLPSRPEPRLSSRHLGARALRNATLPRPPRPPASRGRQDSASSAETASGKGLLQGVAHGGGGGGGVLLPAW